MLEFIKVKNIALIDEAHVNFSSGFNVLSGETGAGKSILIDSINFVLGERATKDIIRHGEASAEVEAFLTVKNTEVIKKIAELGISIDEDNAVLLQRSISVSGKSLCKINGKQVTLGMLREITELLVDIHGQHEHQSLLNPNKHIELLDRFCGKELALLKGELISIYKRFRAITKSINELTENSDKSERQAKIELYSHQINEIESVRLSSDEENVLLSKRKLLLESTKLLKSAQIIRNYFNSENDNMVSVKDVFANIANEITVIAEIDDSQNEMKDRIYALFADIQDVSHIFNDYYETLDIDENELEKIEQRLDTIHKLKRKYGNSIDDIFLFLAKTKEKLDLLKNAEEKLIVLSKNRAQLKKESLITCEKMSVLRKNAAIQLQNEILNNLHDLGMEQADFEINIIQKDEFTINGYDKVEFLIRTNIGDVLKPLVKIASGGEMSRVMLALKAALADFDTIETFIFDEIDTGVSGRTAQKVAEKMRQLSKKHQLLCITHLPQIAAFSDSHYLIEKYIFENSTTTNVLKLDYDQSVSELARLIGGAEITDITLEAAREMKNMAE